jgi:hypothetical protein
MATFDPADYQAELARKAKAATKIVDRCRKCGQTSTTYAGHAAPLSCWGKLPNGRSCNGKAFDRTTKAAKARPAATATARRPAAKAVPARQPVVALTAAQRAALVEQARANVERDRKARVRDYLLTGNY